jgi:SAM-dependent methyltransferase
MLREVRGASELFLKNLFPGAASVLGCARLSRPESKFIEKPPRSRAGVADISRKAFPRERETAINDDLQERAAKVAPYLTRRFGIEFRGRILEIGAGAAWLSAELSKLPGVVEIIATDAVGKRLREEAPRVFARLGAIERKITRMPGDPHRLDFPDNHFDFVVCAAVLNRTVNIASALREAKRVLKPGGCFVAVREPVKSRLKLDTKRAVAERAQTGRRLYTLDEYGRFFAAAGLPVEFKPVHLSSGLKFFFTQMFNGLTHARYALIARKPVRPRSAKPEPKTASTKSSPK